MRKPSSLFSILALFLVIFIDSFGLGIIFPILNPILMNPTGGLLPPQTSVVTREWYYGVTIGLYPLLMFFGAPILGDLSDRFGRKKVLIFCLAGSLFGYLLAVLSLITHHIGWMLFSRAVDGFTSGSQPIAQAAIVDVSLPEKKAVNLSLMMLMVALGLVLGPLLGGVLADPQIVSWFSFQTPLWLAAALSLLNIGLLLRYLPETWQPTANLPRVVWYRALALFTSAFRQPMIRYLAIIYFLIQLGQSSYLQFVTLFLVRQYHYSALYLGLFMAVLGIGFVLAMTLVVRILVRWFAIRHIVWGSLFMAFIMMVLTVWPAAGAIAAWLAAIPVAIASALAFTGMITVFSDRTGDDRQGWIMGITSAISALAWALTGFLEGSFGHFPASAPLWVGSGFMLAGAVLMLIYSFQSSSGNTNGE